MLKIENVSKLLGHSVGGKWVIFEVDEITTSYLIQLRNVNGDKKQINLERTPVKSKENLYELWMWKILDVTAAAVPSRTMLKIDGITDMDRLIGSMEFLMIG